MVAKGEEVQVTPGGEAKLDFTLSSGKGRVLVKVRGAPSKTRYADDVSVVAFKTSLSAGWIPSPEEILGRGVLEGGEATLTKLPEGTIGVAVPYGERRVIFKPVVVAGVEPVLVELVWPNPDEVGTIEGQVEPGTTKSAEGIGVLALGDGIMIVARIEASGKFRLTEVPPGLYRLCCKVGGADASGASGESKVVTVEAKKDVKGVSLVLPPR
jgi:hypothetical protein